MNQQFSTRLFWLVLWLLFPCCLLSFYINQQNLREYRTYGIVFEFQRQTFNSFAKFQENGEVIKLTDYHLLYVTGCTAGEKLRLTFAKDVRLGQCLHVVKKQSNNLVPVQVSNIQRVCLSHHWSIYCNVDFLLEKTKTKEVKEI